MRVVGAGRGGGRRGTVRAARNGEGGAGVAGRGGER